MDKIFEEYSHHTRDSIEARATTLMQSHLRGKKSTASGTTTNTGQDTRDVTPPPTGRSGATTTGAVHNGSHVALSTYTSNFVARCYEHRKLLHSFKMSMNTTHHIMGLRCYMANYAVLLCVWQYVYIYVVLGVQGIPHITYDERYHI